MPRIRSIKYEFYMNEDLASVSMAARLLFIGLWTIADKAGRLEDRPIRIKAQLFPYEDLDINALLDELSPLFLQRYTVDSKAYIQITNFQKHQKPHPKEQESILPEPDKAVKLQGKTRTRRVKDSTCKVVSGISVNGTSVSGVSVNGNGIKSIVAPASPDATSEGKVSESKTAQAVEIFNYWKQEHGRSGRTVFDAKRKRAVMARLADYPVDFIKQAIRGVKLDPHCAGENPSHQVYDDLELICRDASHLEKFAALDVGKIQARGSPPTVTPCTYCLGKGTLMVYDNKLDQDVEKPCFMCHGEKVKAS